VSFKTLYSLSICETSAYHGEYFSRVKVILLNVE